MNTQNTLTFSERRAILALGSLYSFRMLGLFMVLPVLGIYAVDLPGATPEKLGIALGAYGLTQACLQLPLGWLSDRIGRLPIVIVGLCLFIAGSLVAAAADTIHGIIAGRFLQGAGAIAAALTALAADSTRESQRTKAMAVIGASVGLSFVLAIVLGPVIAASLGLQGVFLVTAGLGAIGLVIVLTLLPKNMPKAAAIADGDWAVDHVFGGTLPVLYASVFLLHGLMMATFLIIPGALVNAFAFAAGDHWIIYLLTVVLSIPPALLIMRMGRSGEDPRWALSWAIVSLIGGILMALLAPNLMTVGAGLWLMFVGINALEAILPATVTRVAPGRLRGTALGIFASCQFLGIFVGGALAGFILSAGGSQAVAILASFCALVWLTVLWLKPFTPVIAVVSNE
ncbi:MFS transporter [Luminiphilus sp.]|nr:MFS transporter [Luminiphilus sp.]MDB2352119.1 MFS transporter [Luminiphilus sp.]MDB2615450.1 MFS transporter [Luminiphilus sp.]